jgi:predicted PurR-regulated permease PerM
VRPALALGLVAGLLEFIPTLGPALAALPALAMALLDSPAKALWVLIAYVLIHAFEAHILVPLLMKRRVSLPPALTLLAQAVMGSAFGVLGLLAAVPLAVTTMQLVRVYLVEPTPGDPDQAGARSAPDPLGSSLTG